MTNKNNIAFPHDKSFKAALSNLQVGKDFLSHYLPKHIQEKLDLESLQLEPGSFIDAALKKSETDILYRVQLRSNSENSEAFIYCLIEHQSTPDYWLPFRLLKYLCQIWDRQQNNQFKYLPLIIPIVLYNGDQEYPYSMLLTDLFQDKESAASLFTTPFQLVDLNTIPDTEIRQHTWSGLLEIFLKQARHRDFSELMEEALTYFIKPLLALDTAASSDYITAMLYYGVSQVKIEDLEGFINWFKGKLPNKELEEHTMALGKTFMEYGEERGLQQGLEQGLKQGFDNATHFFIKSLFQECQDLELVARVTGQPLSEIQKILKKS